MRFCFTIFPVALAGFMALCLLAAPAAARPLVIAAFGDSLTEGYGLSTLEAYPYQLQQALRERGYDVVVENHGRSGDTTATGLQRFPRLFSGKQQPDLVLLALGANDMLRRRPADETYDNLQQMLEILQQRKIPVILMGMKAVHHYSPLYRWRLGRVYTRLARRYDVPLLPFFLEGVALQPALNQMDGIHPNAQGVARMVEHSLPLVAETLDALDAGK